MKIYIYILLFISIICGDPRRPTKLTKQCLMKELGIEKVKSLILSFRKYHRTNGKAKFSEFIYEKKPEFKEVLDKCKLNKKRRRIEGEIQKSLLMNQMISDVKQRRGKDAFDKCMQLISNDDFCKTLVITMIQSYIKDK